jgi:hypothetical protein
MSANCNNVSYEDNLDRSDFFENKLYLQNQTCCDANGCDKLSIEYQKLLYKCRDVYGKGKETDEKGRIIDSKTICDGIEEKRDKLSKLSSRYRIVSPGNINTLRDRSRGGKRKFTKNKRNKNKRNKNKTCKNRTRRRYH